MFHVSKLCPQQQQMTQAICYNVSALVKYQDVKKDVIEDICLIYIRDENGISLLDATFGGFGSPLLLKHDILENIDASGTYIFNSTEGVYFSIVKELGFAGELIGKYDF